MSLQRGAWCPPGGRRLALRDQSAAVGWACRRARRGER